MIDSYFHIRLFNPSELNGFYYQEIIDRNSMQSVVSMRLTFTFNKLIVAKHHCVGTSTSRLSKCMCSSLLLPIKDHWNQVGTIVRRYKNCHSITAVPPVLQQLLRLSDCICQHLFWWAIFQFGKSLLEHCALPKEVFGVYKICLIPYLFSWLPFF